MERITNPKGANPKLVAVPLQNGSLSLQLYYYLGRNKITNSDGSISEKKIRRQEKLNLYLNPKARTPKEKLNNQETLRVAYATRDEENLKLKEEREGYKFRRDRQINLLNLYEEYANSSKLKSKRTIILAYNRLKSFLSDTPKYNIYSQNLTAQQLDKELVKDFVSYLQDISEGEGASTSYARFKTFIKFCVDKEVLTKNVCAGISIKIDRNKLSKEVLSEEELYRLATTHYRFENNEIRRAFLFCCFTGLRFCDVKDLTFKNIDYEHRTLRFEQNKTKGHSVSSEVVNNNITDDLLILIGKPKEKITEHIFNLPSANACNKDLKHWTKRAGIDKKITWHCARHTFATLLLSKGNDIKTTATLLGHSGLKYIDRYTRALDENKIKAMNSLPKLNLTSATEGV